MAKCSRAGNGWLVLGSACFMRQKERTRRRRRTQILRLLLLLPVVVWCGVGMGEASVTTTTTCIKLKTPPIHPHQPSQRGTPFDGFPFWPVSNDGKPRPRNSLILFFKRAREFGACHTCIHGEWWLAGWMDGGHVQAPLCTASKQ